MSEKTVKIALLVPLLNFVCGSGSDIIISESASLKKYSYEQLDHLLRQLPKEYYSNLKLALVSTRWFFETSFKLTEADWDIPAITSDVGIPGIITTFRLLKMNSVMTPLAFYVSADCVYVNNPYPRLSAVQCIDELEEKEVPDFIKLSNAVINVPENKPYLEFALLQLNRAIIERSRWLNSGDIEYTDIIAAFESIVFGRVKNAPSPYGLALGIGIGMLLGKSEKERTEIEQKINKAYETRNLVVHGHLRKKLENSDTDEYEEVLDFILECLRLALIKLLLE